MMSAYFEPFFIAVDRHNRRAKNRIGALAGEPGWKQK
jgi:hypothetical protein